MMVTGTVARSTVLTVTGAGAGPAFLSALLLSLQPEPARAASRTAAIGARSGNAVVAAVVKSNIATREAPL